MSFAALAACSFVDTAIGPRLPLPNSFEYRMLSPRFKFYKFCSCSTLCLFHSSPPASYVKVSELRLEDLFSTAKVWAQA